MHWIPNVSERLPLLTPLRCHAGNDVEWPGREALQPRIDAAGLCVVSGRPLRLVEPGGPQPFELRLYQSGELEYRERNWHDWFNLMVWFMFPRAKAALNARHCAAWSDAVCGTRGAVRDTLTLFDESGVVVLAHDLQLLELVSNFEWRALFCGRRLDCLAGLRVLPFGHALCEKALTPYRGITGHALLWAVQPEVLALEETALLAALDAELAQRIADPLAMASTRDLSPLPLLGIPGWCPDNADPSYYDDTRQFRRGRRQRAAEWRP
jgi:hypothetical protein